MVMQLTGQLGYSNIPHAGFKGVAHFTQPVVGRAKCWVGNGNAFSCFARLVRTLANPSITFKIERQASFRFPQTFVCIILDKEILRLQLRISLVKFGKTQSGSVVLVDV